MERKRLCQNVAWLAVGVSAGWLVNRATALANYLRSQDSGPAGTRAKRASVKGAGRKPSGAPGDTKPSAGRPPDITAPERRAVEPRPNPPAAGEAKPAEG